MTNSRDPNSAEVSRRGDSVPAESQRFSGIRRASTELIGRDVSGPEVEGLVGEPRARRIEVELHSERLGTQLLELVRRNEELVRAKAELGDLYEHGPVGYVSTDHEGVVLAANLRFAALLGQPRSRLLAHPLSDVIECDDQDAYDRHRTELRETGERRVCEVRMRRAAGEVFWAALESVVVCAAGGAQHVRTAVSDITRRKNAEEEQRRLRECLEQSQKMEAIGTLAGGIAHDINNILAVILALGSRLERGLPKDDARWQDVREIVSAVYRGKRLTQDLLEFARKGPRRKEVCSPNDAIVRLVEVLERTVPKRIRIELGLDERLACVECDPDQLVQMLLNICLNSVDALAGHGTIMIATTNVQATDPELCLAPDLPAGPYVRIDVCDDGPGMDDQTQRRAFDPFFTTKDVGEGTGLGLSVVYGAVRELKGHVRIISKVNIGTTVRIVLPACQSASRRRSWIPASGQTVVPAGAVLVVDDEPMVRAAYQRVLEGLGYRVIVADGGASALTLYEANRDGIDVVLLDMSMPVMDGAECYARLRRLDPDVRVVICTGRAREEAEQRVFAEGMPYFVNKPCSVDELAGALAEAVQTAPTRALASGPGSLAPHP